MARRFEVGVVQASHDGTQEAERQRERARPRSYVPPFDPEPQPAAWEATSEPQQGSQPQPGRGQRVVVRQAPAGGAVLSREDVDAVRFALMQREVHGNRREQSAAVEARRALSRRQGEGQT